MIPDKALQQHVAILGKTGAGKSYCARGIVESLLDQQHRVCVIDPKGDWWGLRLSATGKSAGYPVVIFGGAHGDLPINAHAGGSIAELVATGNRPTILDLSELTMGERTRLFMDFAAGLFRHNKGPLWLVIDEVHNFAPQGKVLDPDAGKMLHWANRLASEGRGKGIQIIMASQRPQKVHKDTLTCAETLVAMRVVHNLDRAALKEWMDGAGDKGKAAAVLNSLAGMPRGEAWVWSPELGYFERVKSPKIRTYDSMSPAPPDATPLKGWAEVNLDDVRTKLADVVKEAEANDPRLLKKEIADLKKELNYSRARPDQFTVQQEVQKAVREAENNWRRQHVAEITERDRIIRDLSGRMGKAAGKAGELAAMLHVNGEATPRPIPVPAKTVSKPAPSINVPRTTVQKPGEQPIGGGLRRMMAALAQRPGLSARQLGVRSGLSSSSGTFSTYLARGRTEGWISGDRSRMELTPVGASALGDYDPLPEGPELAAYWLGELGDSGAARILRALIEAYPEALTKEALGERAGLSAGSGTFGTYLSKLRTLELVEGRSELKASEELF